MITTTPDTPAGMWTPPRRGGSRQGQGGAGESLFLKSRDSPALQTGSCHAGINGTGCGTGGFKGLQKLLELLPSPMRDRCVTRYLRTLNSPPVRYSGFPCRRTWLAARSDRTGRRRQPGSAVARGVCCSRSCCGTSLRHGRRLRGIGCGSSHFGSGSSGGRPVDFPLRGRLQGALQHPSTALSWASGPAMTLLAGWMAAIRPSRTSRSRREGPDRVDRAFPCRNAS